MQADIRTDIRQWDYTVYPRGHFNFIWASPPCTEYSAAKTRGIRKLEEANEIVQRVLRIIDYFAPQFFVIENPQTGLLKRQPFMQHIPFRTSITVGTTCHIANGPDFGTTSILHLGPYVVGTAERASGGDTHRQHSRVGIYPTAGIGGSLGHNCTLSPGSSWPRSPPPRGLQV